MYDRYYQEYCDEVHKVLASYLFWRMLHNKVGSDKALLNALNITPLSWILIRHSLQVNLFITLGRIFDVDDEAFSVDDLLKCCIAKIDVFNLDNLRKRKMNDRNGSEPEWLLGYLKEAYVPIAEDFYRLRGEVAKRRKIFEAVYRPIRHKLIAHNDKRYLDRSDELWAETKIQELEEIIWFLNDLKVTLFETYQNGKKPILKGVEPDLEFYEDDFGKLLENTKNA